MFGVCSWLLAKNVAEGDVSSLPLLQCEFSSCVPDHLNHLLHRGEQQEGTWDNDGILKLLAGWLSRSNIKWSSDNFSFGSAGAQLSLGSRNSSLAKAGSFQRGCYHTRVSLNLWKVRANSAVQLRSREDSCSWIIFLPAYKNQMPWGCVQSRRHAWVGRLSSSDSCILLSVPLPSESVPECQVLSMLISLCLLDLVLKKNSLWTIWEETRVYVY